ncbi:MAG: adenylyltransferase/cytidyltransferase family protein [Lachnospiraceae bacterium]|nr:adenylyltransferase/cytidyltransferase family protein [Lachnospiraceae bacterium]
MRNYCIFDPSKAYPRAVKSQISTAESKEGRGRAKKYRVGYVAGVFDMFHAGHLNLLRRAKEQCECLIVGLVSDEGVYRKKEKYPVIPCQDRLEIVRACRYVDQAEELPLSCDGIRDAWKLFQFDCQFTGTDHGDHPSWLADKEFLEKQGVDLVFFPYTERVSSTMLREKLKEGGEL